MRKVFLVLLSFTFFIPVSSAADGNATSQSITTTHLTGSVYLLQGKGGNIAVSVGEDGVLAIDGDYPEMIDKVQEALHALSDDKVKFLVNTHWHGDHTGANEVLGREATILAQENVRTRLSSRQVLEIFGKVSEPKAREGLPVVTFRDSVTIHFNGETMDIRHYANSHTDGDSVIFFREANVVHLGDLFFNGIYPFIDVEHGGNVEGLMRSLDSLIEDIPEDATIIPGHGPAATLQDLRDYRTMLGEATDIMKGYLEQGMSLEEIEEASLPDSITSVWGKGFLPTDVWLKILYHSYRPEGAGAASAENAVSGQM